MMNFLLYMTVGFTTAYYEHNLMRDDLYYQIEHWFDSFLSIVGVVLFWPIYWLLIGIMNLNNYWQDRKALN